MSKYTATQTHEISIRKSEGVVIVHPVGKNRTYVVEKLTRTVSSRLPDHVRIHKTVLAYCDHGVGAEQVVAAFKAFYAAKPA